MNDIDHIFAAYVTRSDEASRVEAYEAGRRVLADGVGLAEWMGEVHRAVIAALTRAKTPDDCARVRAAAGGFLLECLSSYEMAFQGAREANEALRRQNELLEGETRRIAHEIHDSAGQILVCACLELQRLAIEAPATTSERLARVTEMLDQVQTHLRRFSRELRPTILDDLGLVPALESLARSVSSRTGITVSVEGSTAGRLPTRTEVALYRVVQEALTNTTRHSGAKRADVLVERREREVRCVVTDDGVGFADVDPDSLGRGLGLVGMRERVAPLGGLIHWGTAPRAKGAVVSVTIPLEIPYVAPSTRC